MTSDLEREAPWMHRLAALDHALAERLLSRAFYEWHEAHADAFRSGRWAALVAVGDAALRIDAVAGVVAGFRADARRVYLAALVRARAERSAEGAGRVAEAFTRLGDTQLAQHARRVESELW
ncbi:MAG: hypothetical protein FJ027_22375 [Candidatus Rokubacteria bacterium]|nr:hypothetical protein [Candidatus Rokubacteria bacterium]